MDFVLKDIYPQDFDELERIGHGIAGSPATVRDYLEKSTARGRRQLRAVPDDVRRHELPMTRTTRSTLFGHEVMPEFS